MHLGSPVSAAGSVWSARWIIVLAAVMWSSSGFFAKAPLFENWPQQLGVWPIRGPVLAFWRAVFAGLVLVPLIRRPRWRPELIPMTLVFAAMNFAFLTALTKTSEANAIWLQNLAPLWVFLGGVLFLGERVRPRDWRMLCGCGAGISLIVGCNSTPVCATAKRSTA